MTSYEQFKKWFVWVIAWEGEAYENDPNDNGGETKYGIDAASHPGVNIRGLTLQKAHDIYWAEWQESPASWMPYPLGWAFFDARENQGLNTAVRCLQRAVGVPDDGIIGPVTRSAVSQWEHVDLLTSKFIDKRDASYHGLVMANPRKYGRYLNGWINRINDLRVRCLVEPK